MVHKGLRFIVRSHDFNSNLLIVRCCFTKCSMWKLRQIVEQLKNFIFHEIVCSLKICKNLRIFTWNRIIPTKRVVLGHFPSPTILILICGFVFRANGDVLWYYHVSSNVNRTLIWKSIIQTTFIWHSVEIAEISSHNFLLTKITWNQPTHH